MSEEFKDIVSGRQGATIVNDTTLNGKIRNHIVQDGYATSICDVASDPTMGIYSGGIAGVGELNTTYFNVDGIHPTTTGYNYLADNYFIPSINARIYNEQRRR